MILDKFKLTNQVAIITGAGRGVGKGIALAFAEAGANIVCAARTLEQIDATAAEVRARGQEALVVRTDVRDAEQVEQLVNRTIEEFGQLDIMVNNAGGGFFTSLIDTTLKDFEAVLRKNLLSCFLGSKAAAKVMIKQNAGKIINISSRAGQQGTMNVGHYGAAKAGVNLLTETLAWELAKYNIRVNCLCLGPVLHETSDEVFMPLRDIYMAEGENIQGRLLIQRFGLPEDVGAFCVFLASAASSWITGKIYEIDGGMRATPTI
ncbi:SDR family NAD(P)-dependent oxidoreductase [Chloroflexota bacterium]